MVKTTDAGGYALMRLYEISSSIAQLETMEYADKQTIEDTLEALEIEFDEKIQSIGKIVKNLESDIESIKNEEERLKKNRSSIEKRVYHLREYVKTCMIESGKTKVSSGVITWSIQLNPPKVDVEPGADIPLCWYTEKVVRDLDKNAIKQAIVGGATIPGCRLIQEQSIRLK